MPAVLSSRLYGLGCMGRKGYPLKMPSALKWLPMEASLHT
ncbi:hypothetical protein EC253486_3278 [Escherichia coli 2534-86]|nr:hypothetical protein EC253486_3278 [Escherichia coli 2534-86]KDY77518.1 putative antirepressor protein Cro [Escherichia coli 2-474-04_S1_C1]